MMAGNIQRHAGRALAAARIVAAIALAILLGAAAYVALGLAGGAIPAGGNRSSEPRDIRIFVEDNGIHTDIVVPKHAAGVDWTTLVGAGDIADPRYAGYDHLAIGWGERAFFIGTPSWADLDLATVLHAALGSDDTVLHIEHVPAPETGPQVHAIVLSDAQYRRLAGFIARSFAAGPPRSVKGYGANDAFYAARGHYDMFDTCNAWTGRALRFAGVRTGAWTPFPDGVIRWLEPAGS